MSRKRRRVAPAPTISPDNGPTPELLTHLETIVLDAKEWGWSPPRRILPAHIRLYRANKIDSAARDAADWLSDAWTLAYEGETRPGSGTGGNIVSARMLAADRIRLAERVIGKGALQIIVAACVDCLPGAVVAWRLLGFREPPERATARAPRWWWDDGRRALDGALVPILGVLGDEY